MKRMPVLLSFILFLALCASAAYWVLQFWRPPVRPMAPPVAVAGNDLPPDAAAGLFGGRPAAVGVASNYQLKGVVVADNPRESVAIVSADGKPAQAVGLNTEFQPGVSVREVHAQYILLSESGVVKRVPLPDAASAPQASFIPTVGMPAPQAQMAPQSPVQIMTGVPAQVQAQTPNGMSGQMVPGAGYAPPNPAPGAQPPAVYAPLNPGNAVPQHNQ